MRFEVRVCGRCYGRNLATYDPMRSVRRWESSPRGPSDSPGTQLTMRTFHIGGAATKISEENRVS